MRIIGIVSVLVVAVVLPGNISRAEGRLSLTLSPYACDRGPGLNGSSETPRELCGSVARIESLARLPTALAGPFAHWGMTLAHALDDGHVERSGTIYDRRGRPTDFVMRDSQERRFTRAGAFATSQFKTGALSIMPSLGLTAIWSANEATIFRSSTYFGKTTEGSSTYGVERRAVGIIAGMAVSLDLGRGFSLAVSGHVTRDWGKARTDAPVFAELFSPGSGQLMADLGGETFAAKSGRNDAVHLDAELKVLWSVPQGGGVALIGGVRLEQSRAIVGRIDFETAVKRTAVMPIVGLSFPFGN
jgi:hypothetical protein